MTEVAPESEAPTESGNAKPYSVSELAFALKRTLEDAYGFVARSPRSPTTPTATST
jgi:exodeoxyribonuclease VII large subunit